MKINTETAVTQTYTAQTAQKVENIQSPKNKFIVDSVEISDEGKRKSRDESVGMQAQLEMMQKQVEAAQKQGEAMSKTMEVQMKCMTIAMHIISGDKVPQEDHRYLSEKDRELYMKALSMRIEKEKPEECDRVSEDEEEENNNNSEEASTIKGGAGMLPVAKTEKQTETQTEGENLEVE